MLVNISFLCSHLLEHSLELAEIDLVVAGDVVLLHGLGNLLLGDRAAVFTECDLHILAGNEARIVDIEAIEDSKQHFLVFADNVTHVQARRDEFGVVDLVVFRKIELLHELSEVQFGQRVA